MIASTLIYAGLLPLLFAATIAFVMRRFRAPPQTIWAVAFACGFVAGAFSLKARAGLPVAFRSYLRPSEAGDWLPLIVLIAAGISIIIYHAPTSAQRWTTTLATLLAISAPIRLLAGNVAQRWTALERIAYLLLLAATLGLIWLLLGSTRDEDQPFVRTMLFVVVAAGTAVVVSLSGVLVYGEFSGAAAAAIAGTALGIILGAGRISGVWRQSLVGLSGAAGVVAFSLGGLIILGHFYGSLSALNALLLFISLAAAGGPLPEVIQRGPEWRAAIIRAAASLVPLAVALVIATTS
jgi:hypothetical protein